MTKIVTAILWLHTVSEYLYILFPIRVIRYLSDNQTSASLLNHMEQLAEHSPIVRIPNNPIGKRMFRSDIEVE